MFLWSHGLNIRISRNAITILIGVIEFQRPRAYWIYGFSFLFIFTPLDPSSLDFKYYPDLFSQFSSEEDIRASRMLPVMVCGMQALQCEFDSQDPCKVGYRILSSHLTHIHKLACTHNNWKFLKHFKNITSLVQNQRWASKITRDRDCCVNQCPKMFTAHLLIKKAWLSSGFNIAVFGIDLFNFKMFFWM